MSSRRAKSLLGTKQRGVFPGPKKEDLVKKWKIVKGDKVSVLRGTAKGHTGTVIKVMRAQNKLIVRGANKTKRHIAANEQGKGGMYKLESPIHYSAVALVDPTTRKPTKISIQRLEDGTKVRVSKKSGAVIPKRLPESYLSYVKGTKKQGAGPKDTSPDLTLQKTLESVKLNDLD